MSPDREHMERMLAHCEHEFAKVKHRDGSESKAYVEKGYEPPVERAELVRLAMAMRDAALAAADDLRTPPMIAGPIYAASVDLNCALARERAR